MLLNPRYLLLTVLLAVAIAAQASTASGSTVSGKVSGAGADTVVWT